MKKSEIIQALESSHEQILSMIEGLPVDLLTLAGTVGDWSIKDVLSHLLIWEAETIKLMYMARLHRKPDTAHFKTISDDEQNSIWYEQFKERPYERVWRDYATIRDQTIERVSEFSDADLNNERLFPWLKGNSLSGFLVSFILEHEAEHGAAIRKSIVNAAK